MRRREVPTYSLAGLQDLARRAATQAAAYLSWRNPSVASDETFERWVHENDGRTLMEFVEGLRQ